MEEGRQNAGPTPGKSSKKRSTGAHCLAPGCTNSRRKNKKVHYHRLPLANKPLLNVWLSKMKLARPPKLEHARICGDHFTTQDYESRGTFDDSGRFVMKQTSILKETAVPTLFDFSGYSQGNTDAPSRSTSIVMAGIS